ncbi:MULTISPECIES: fimbria/pilus outer membrane usher protein [Symbiopectobacterium]|uniref:fimbria/pilus outer membrane usher protein n=1 Tax=Symbiopectobacterium TaxID=801 RepID=UPI00207A2BAE|nr:MULTISPECIES: fimbria/pilus outer membrane usher protein [Symbiopectobacterium]
MLCASTVFAAEEFGSLPPPPTAPPAQQQALYYLTLAVNGYSDNLVVPVSVNGDRYAADASELARRHIKLPTSATGQIEINTLPDVTVFYDSQVQQLNAGGGSGTPRLSARSSTGLLFNYNLFYTSPPQQGDTMNALMEQRLFSDYGTLSNSGLWVIKSSYTDDGSRYRRYDTYWRYSGSGRVVSYQLGDLISNSLTWGQSARMAGLRMGRNFNLRPDIVTYPMLQYACSAAVPSTLDLFINGFKTSSMALNSGPFTLTNTPYLNGVGEATIITTDAQGRQIATSMPFYVSNTLLRQGLSDFDLSVGLLRQTYGLGQDRYASDPAFRGFYRYSVTQNLTLARHGETVRGLSLLGAGADMAVGRWGTLSTAYSHSERDGRGQQYVFGYPYYGNTVGFNVQHQRRTLRYQDLSTYATPGNMSKESLQATLSSMLFGPANGTVGMSYFAITTFNDPRTELVNLSYTRQLWGNSTLYLAANKTLGDRGHSAQIQVIIPFGSSDTFNTSMQRNNQGENLTTLGVTRTLPLDGGFGWNLAYSAGNDPYHQGTLVGEVRITRYRGDLWQRGEPNALGRNERLGNLSGW